MNITKDNVKSITISQTCEATNSNQFWREIRIQLQDGSEIELSLWSDDPDNLTLKVE